MKLIDKSALVAEINKRIIDAPVNNIGHQRVWAYNDVKDIINTLELKEVDLEKEINKYISDNFFGSETMGFFAARTNEEPNDIDIALCAKYFFELGLKVQIMKPKLQQRIGVLKMGFWTGLQTFEETEMTLSDAYNQGVDDILEELGLNAQKGK